MVVIDANALLATIMSLPWSSAARTAILRDRDLIAPSLLNSELANAIWRATRAGLLNADQGSRGLRRALLLVATVDDRDLADRALELAIQHRHPAYDCFYMALVEQSGAVLLTADRRLGGLAMREGLPVHSLV